jgi:hypothetical protein
VGHSWIRIHKPSLIRILKILFFWQGPAAVPEAGPGGVLRQEADQEGGGQRQVCGGSGPQETDPGQEDHEKHRQKTHTRSAIN